MHIYKSRWTLKVQRSFCLFFAAFISYNILDIFLCCQIYRILGKTVVCYPIVFDLSDFYLSQDVMLLIDDIKVSCCDVTPG